MREKSYEYLGRTITYRLLEDADDVTPDIEEAIESAVDWFEDSPTMGVTEFIDRLCKTYGGGEVGGFDLESYDNPAARKIMRVARKIRKDRQEWG